MFVNHHIQILYIYPFNERFSWDSTQHLLLHGIMLMVTKHLKTNYINAEFCRLSNILQSASLKVGTSGTVIVITVRIDVGTSGSGVITSSGWDIWDGRLSFIFVAGV